MSNAEIQRLAARIVGLEQQVRGLSAPSLAYSAIEGGAIESYDPQGALGLLVGTQWDGSQLAAPVNGPVPPQPSLAVVSAIPGGLTVAWDGTWADPTVVTTMDFSRMEVHVLPPGASYTGSAETLRATLETPRGADVTILPLEAEPHSVVLVARSLSGRAGIPSQPVTVTPDFAASGEALATITAAVARKNSVHYSTVSPVEPGDTVGDVWFRRDGEVVIGQWEWTGQGWEPRGLWGVTNTSGTLVSAVGRDGHMTVSGLSVEGDPVIGGTALSEHLGGLPGGVLAWGYRDTAGVSTSMSEAPFLEIQFDLPYRRLVRVDVAGMGLSSSTSSGRAVVYLHTALDGESVSTTSPFPAARRYLVPVAGAVVGVPNLQHDLVNDTHPDGREVRLLVSYLPEAGSIQLVPQNRVSILVEDKGPLPQNSALVRDLGQVPTTATSKTYVKEYEATGAATFRADGARRTDTTEVIQGVAPSNGGGHGDQRGFYVFSPQMQTDLAGATVTKVEVFTYATYWYGSSGIARIYVHPHRPDANLTRNPGGTTFAINSAGWPKPGGRWVTLPTSFNAGFAAGTHKGFGLGSAGTADLAYHGRFNRGRIRVTYVR